MHQHNQNNEKKKNKTGKPIIVSANTFYSFVAILLIALAIATNNCSSSAQAASSFHASDCMRNPFASGCRGISAKRSLAPPGTENWHLSFGDNGGGGIGGIGVTDDSINNSNDNSYSYQQLASRFANDLTLAPPEGAAQAQPQHSIRTRQSQGQAGVEVRRRQVFHAAQEALVESLTELVSLCVEHQLAQLLPINGRTNKAGYGDGSGDGGKRTSCRTFFASAKLAPTSGDSINQRVLPIVAAVRVRADGSQSREEAR